MQTKTKENEEKITHTQTEKLNTNKSNIIIKLLKKKQKRVNRENETNPTCYYTTFTTKKKRKHTQQKCTAQGREQVKEVKQHISERTQADAPQLKAAETNL